jgi:putative oxidoreductase
LELQHGVTVAVETERKQYRISPAQGVVDPLPRDWRIADVGVAALRAAVALLLLLHAAREFFGVLLPGNVAWLGAPGMFTDRWIAASTEVVGAVLLGAGMFTRSATVTLAFFVVLSYFAPARARGHWNFGGAELVALYTSVLLAIAFMGPGVFSIDAWRARRKRPKGSGPRVSMSPWIKRQYRHRELTR